MIWFDLMLSCFSKSVENTSTYFEYFVKRHALISDLIHTVEHDFMWGKGGQGDGSFVAE